MKCLNVFTGISSPLFFVVFFPRPPPAGGEQQSSRRRGQPESHQAHPVVRQAQSSSWPAFWLFFFIFFVFLKPKIRPPPCPSLTPPPASVTTPIHSSPCTQATIRSRENEFPPDDRCVCSSTQFGPLKLHWTCKKAGWASPRGHERATPKKRRRKKNNTHATSRVVSQLNSRRKGSRTDQLPVFRLLFFNRVQSYGISLMV